MAEYMLSVWHDEEYEVDFTSPDAQRIHAKVMAFNDKLVGLDALKSGVGLMPRSTAMFARPDGTTTSGPYCTDARHMGGFWVVEAPDRATAEQWLVEASAACEAPVELRPFQGE